MDRGRRPTDVHPTRVYLYRLRSILRHRWSDYLLLTLTVAAVGGLAMGSVVAGRRTQSAYASFLRHDDASTLIMSTYGIGSNSPANFYSTALEQRLRHLPEIAEVGTWVGTNNAPLEPDGSLNFAVLNSVNIAASLGGVFFHEDRVTVIKGRMANPADPYQFMTSELGARLLGVHLGQTLVFGTTGETIRLPMRLVAIVAFNDAVIQDDTDRTPVNLVFTPALARTEENQGNGTWYAIRLKPGVKDIGQVEQQLTRLLPAGGIDNFKLTAATEAKVESAMRPESIAIGVFGLIAGLSTVGICLPIMARLLVNSQDEREVLRALGASKSAIAADFYIGIGASVFLGTVLASVVSVAVGSFAPLGPVRTVYHPRDWSPDWAVTTGGVAVLVGTLFGAAVIMGIRRAGRKLTPYQPGPPARVSRAVDAAASAGLPATAVVGARFAVEPGQGRSSVPARSVLFGAILSVALVVTTVTFASGLRTLVSRPALYGWDWGYALTGYYGLPPDAQAALRNDPSVQAWAGYTSVNAPIDGHSVPVLISVTTPSVRPPLVSGHEPGVGQIVLGQATLTALHKRVGETVGVGYGSPNTAPLYLPPQPLKIVGTATFPTIAGATTFADHTSMGVGGLFSFDSLPRSFVLQTQSPDPVQSGPALVFVRFRPSVSKSTAAAHLRRIVAIANQEFASDPQAVGDVVSYLPVQRPASIVNYQSTGDTPLVLASGLAVAAIVALALSMVASVRRRRRDLAVLKTLGFVRRQMIGAVAAQALVTALLADAFGIPLGIAAGRQLWIAFARSIDAVPAPTVPASVALVAVGAVLISLLVAVLPGRLAARTPAARVLRAD